MVRRGCDSHSMMPPWSPTILATSARPSPDPVGFVVTNGSNRCGISSSGTPGPLSLTQNSSGSEIRALAPGSDKRTPGRNAGVSQPLHLIEHHVDVDRFALDRPLVGEHFHAIDQLHDAVGLVANQLRQG